MKESIAQYMSEQNPFILFGTDHILGFLIFAILWVIIPFGAKKYLNKNTQKQVGLALSLIVMSNYIIWVVLEILAGTFDFKLHLPFHLCRFANLAIPFIFIRRNETLFQILYYWGMSGMVQGAITPDVTHGFPHFHYFRFFFGHNGMVLVLIYAIVINGYRPTLRGLYQSFLGINAFLALAAIVNISIGSNYFWICGKPPTASLLDYLGPWPVYILAAEFVALIHFIIAYIPFHYLNRKLQS